VLAVQINQMLITTITGVSFLSSDATDMLITKVKFTPVMKKLVADPHQRRNKGKCFSCFIIVAR